MAICQEFQTDRRQRVVFDVLDGCASQLIPVVSGEPLGSIVLGPNFFILYSNEMFDLLKNGMLAYADDSTLLALVSKPADRPAVAASLNFDMVSNREWCNRCASCFGLQ